ncbi:hypothetical protein KFL_000430210 [Klebsormidium nitens]|uniref:peptidylprolyl isomerase n=1 Tax=Klebsormidium nitens TaxID=105231 RepID=A0A1Y1HS29_KLENI|nr:hypothetical protein KFL_000430210 [Klebsormidium nitens]|eukprot:GAQ79979.1 hypothetical protein KFL_000430210 [Klebsormidium nitens]
MMAAANTSTFTGCQGSFTSTALRATKQGTGNCIRWKGDTCLWTPLGEAALQQLGRKRQGARIVTSSPQTCLQCTLGVKNSIEAQALSPGLRTTRRRALIAESLVGREALSRPHQPSAEGAASQCETLTSQGTELTSQHDALPSERSRRSLLLFAAGALLSTQLIPPVLAEESIASPALTSQTVSTETSAESGSIRKKLEEARKESSAAASEPGAVRKKLDAARKEEASKDAVKVEVYKDERRPVAKDEVLDDYEKKLLTYNRKIQKLNNAPRDFPGFIREGYDVRVVTSSEYKTSGSGLLYRDYEEGSGPQPEEGQQVIFHYTGYNESGKRVDSSYQQNRPSETRIGINGMIPGFEEGVKTMRVGGKRRVIVPPDLGPPTGPSTFFSAKQFEVFDIELLGIKNCKRRQIGFYSDLVCDDVVAEIPAELK